MRIGSAIIRRGKREEFLSHREAIYADICMPYTDIRNGKIFPKILKIKKCNNHVPNGIFIFLNFLFEK